jgi:type II secretory pathway component PulM
MSHVTRRFSLDRISPRERAVLLAGASVLVLALIHAYGVSPFLNAAASRREFVKAEREALARQLDVIRGSSATRAELAVVSRVLRDAIPRVFSSPAEEGGTVAALAAVDAHIERLARESGVRLDRISTKPDSTIAADDVLTRVDVTIGASASIPALVELLDVLEGGAKLIRVTRVRLLGRVMNVGPDGMMNFELDLAAYILMPLVTDAPSPRS